VNPSTLKPPFSTITRPGCCPSPLRDRHLRSQSLYFLPALRRLLRAGCEMPIRRAARD
jgi:hypothetical protein